ncbi:hypothetical protein ABT364_13255 [Massilia sp. SR12]
MKLLLLIDDAIMTIGSAKLAAFKNWEDLIDENVRKMSAGDKLTGLILPLNDRRSSTKREG